MKYNILVTGCGGDIGQSIGKILNESDFVSDIYGCDISSKNAGKFVFKNYFIGLPFKDENYLANLERIVEEKNIDFIIPISEPELRYFSKINVLDHIGKAKMITASLKALSIGFDKLATANFLEEKKLPFPNTFLVSEKRDYQFPVILKSRTGSGSAAVYKVEDIDELEFLRVRNPDFIVQEYLEDELGEFTCGVFKSRSGIIRTLIFKRELTGGYSGYGEVIKDQSIHDLLVKLAQEIDLLGSINVQLRLTSIGPVVFEINPRFSSTVLFRHMFGFKDLEWSIKDLLGIELGAYIAPEPGSKFYKGFNEYIEL